MVAPAAIKPESRPINLDDADAVVDAVRLHVGGVDYFLGLLNGGEVAERAIDVRTSSSMVLGIPTTEICSLRRLDFFDNVMSAALGAVAADREQNVDAALLQEVDDDVGADRTARGAQQRAAELVDAC